ncbi:hypothetical protein FA95DRAFT_1682863 [Auriscalpium vulgare]|uniref:Uncharacterized protein n=1 Tax=Auriscalpium vulgare TaxID=40419 RepID=A0ACB8REC1_9AGAM|nr:hypothetical protein FA95DRAFT_1682863 [Auriscalpium vulgare]
MFPGLQFETLLFSAAIALLAVNASYKLAGLAWVRHIDALTARLADPTDGLFPVEKRPVMLEFDYWLRYGIHDVQQWAVLVPHDGVVRVGPAHEPATVAMLHELRCIDVVRAALAVDGAQRDWAPTHHCMNYLRQTVVCRGDTFLEPYQYASKIDPVDGHPIRRCWDWNAVYDAVYKNQREWVGNGTQAGSGEERVLPGERLRPMGTR